MSISASGSALAVCVGAALLLPLDVANAQMRQDDPDMADVARTPLEDFNIDSKDIPEILVAAAANPYDDSGINNCNDVIGQIAILDNALGPDFDIPQDEARRINAGRVAKSVVGSFIPFRSIVREVSGANKKRNELRLAYTAGMVRRGYLKGMGEARGCSYPARPRDGATAEDAMHRENGTIPENLPRTDVSDESQDLVPIEQ